jgi:ABC-type transport system involved in cytochrome c biogenesis permease component
MTFLPIVQRELRAASRRPSTHRIRCWTAFLAIGASLIASAAGTAIPGAGSAVNPLFAVQTVCAFGLSLLAGLFLNSDCLSEEKREGTFGLLLLTDLKSQDIVLGKFVAAALSALYCLLALLPVMAVPLLLGGVTLGEFWRMALALVNAMFFSLAAGLCVSAFVSDYRRRMGHGGVRRPPLAQPAYPAVSRCEDSRIFPKDACGIPSVPILRGDAAQWFVGAIALFAAAQRGPHQSPMASVAPHLFVAAGGVCPAARDSFALGPVQPR